MISLSQTQNETVDGLARVGLIAKGVVYVALGALAFMAAFEFAGHNENEANRAGVFQWLKETGGSWLLIVIAAGLVCYCIWRYVQAFTNFGGGEKTAKRLRYFFSGLAYTSVAFTAGQLGLQSGKQGSNNEHWTSQLMSQPMGQILALIAALILAAIGIYQIWYSLSGNYRKHVQNIMRSGNSTLLLRTGKIGYIARGIVWLILAYLLGRAAMNNNASEAGDTSKAFQLVEGTFGSYLLGAIGLGLLAYGIFNFVRAKYERLG